jgi:hypothetical protein
LRPYVTIHVTTTPSNSSLCLYLPEMNGGRDRTRTCDLLRVKENHPLQGLYRFSPIPNIYNTLGKLLSLK